MRVFWELLHPRVCLLEIGAGIYLAVETLVWRGLFIRHSGAMGHVWMNDGFALCKLPSYGLRAMLVVTMCCGVGVEVVQQLEEHLRLFPLLGLLVLFVHSSIYTTKAVVAVSFHEHHGSSSADRRLV